ncbi:MAG TPA: GAF domain-containing protein [Acidimicrobiia bacterium]|nr:GAF domain-containing protein [Acidimicrobiia bacterium]
MTVDFSSQPFAELLEVLPDGVIVLTASGRIVMVNGQASELSGYLPQELVDEPVEKLVPAALRAEHVALRSGYVSNGGAARPMSARLDIVLLRADHTELPVDIALGPIKVADEQLIIATIRDASIRREAAVVVEHEQALLNAMNRISVALLEGYRLDETFQAITRDARRLVDADYAMLTIPNDDGSELVIRYVDGDGISSLEGSVVPIDASMAGLVIRDREPVLLVDASTDARMFRPPAWPRDAGPALFVPMPAGSAMLGSLTVANRRHRNLFTVADIARVRAFAGHAAVVLEDRRRQEEIQRLNVLDEDRERVASVLHSTVIARVSSAALRLHGLLGEALPAEATDRLWEVIDELDAATKAIRDAVFPRG